MKIKNTSIIILLSLSFLTTIFHISILIKLIPYDKIWGGNLRTDKEMYLFEITSIVVNLFYSFILLQRGKLIKAFFSNKVINIILWIFFILFILNTIGNLIAETNFEKLFSILTLINSFFLWKINYYRKYV